MVVATSTQASVPIGHQVLEELPINILTDTPTPTAMLIYLLALWEFPTDMPTGNSITAGVPIGFSMQHSF